MSLTIDAMAPDDWDAVRRIYEEGIATGVATFETTAPDWADWDAEHLPECRVVARDGDEVVGWSALSPVSDRCVYGGVAEVGVYVGASARGRGAGKLLLGALIKQSEAAGIWTLQAGMLADNEASVGLHHACGFRTVGTRERLGKLDDRWRDVLLLERRSSEVGI